MSVSLCYCAGVLCLTLLPDGIPHSFDAGKFLRVAHQNGATGLVDLANEAMRNPGEDIEGKFGSVDRVPYPRGLAIAEGLSIIADAA